MHCTGCHARRAKCVKGCGTGRFEGKKTHFCPSLSFNMEYKLHLIYQVPANSKHIMTAAKKVIDWQVTSTIEAFWQISSHIHLFLFLHLSLQAMRQVQPWTCKWLWKMPIWTQGHAIVHVFCLTACNLGALRVSLVHPWREGSWCQNIPGLNVRSTFSWLKPSSLFARLIAIWPL